jgi:integrase
MTKHRRGFGNVRRLPSGRWQARYTVDDGRKVSAEDTFKLRIDAEAWLAERKRDMDAGSWRQAPRERVTFGDYSESWLAERHVNGRPLKARTRDHYRSILDQHLLPTFGGRTLAGISPADVKRWHASTLTNRPTLRAHAYSLLRSVLNSAVTDELCDSNPARIRGAGSTTRARTIRTATPAEITELTKLMPPRWALMIPLAGWCGLRFGEAVELRRADIDLADECIRVRRGAVRTSDGYVVDTTKSAAGSRDVSIPPHLVPLIEAHLAEYVGNSADSLLFATDGGGHLQPGTFARHWHRARKAIGRNDLRFHDLRHTAGTLAAQSGATLKELMDRLGHSSVGAAIRYQHTAEGRSRELAAKLSKLADA